MSRIMPTSHAMVGGGHLLSHKLKRFVDQVPEMITYFLLRGG